MDLDNGSRLDLRAISDEEAAKLIPLDDMLVLVTQDDVVKRRVFDPAHRSFIPDFGSFIRSETGGKVRAFAISRQTVLFCVERRKAWRLLQSKAGLVNRDYLAQKAVLSRASEDGIPVEELRRTAGERFAEELANSFTSCS